MATREELRELARLRLREAEALYEAELYDGCVYLCGYVVELALKTCVCATLAILEYPDKRPFLTHDFDELALFAGLQREITLASPALLQNWSVATQWKPDLRYQPAGSYLQSQAEEVLKAIQADPDGVLQYLSRRW